MAAADDLRARLERWLARIPPPTRCVVECGGETVVDLGAGVDLAEELASAAEDLAAARNSAISLAIRAIARDGQPYATLRLRVAAPRPATAGDDALQQLLRVLTSHTQELTRIIVQSQSAILQSYRDVIAAARVRAEEAEARAAALERELAGALDAQQQSAPGQLAEAVLARLVAGPQAGTGGGGSA